MKATLYGNDIRSMKFCKGAVAYKPDRLDLETLARQGFASLYLEGAHKGSCFQFLNKDGKVLLEKTF